MSIRSATLCAAAACGLLLLQFAEAARQYDLRAEVTADRITLRGVTSSEAHEMVLRRTVELRAPWLETRFDWERSAELPNGWSLITEFAVRMATMLEQGSVTVTDRQLTVSGTSPEVDELQRTIGRLEPLLLPGMTVESEVVPVSGERESFAALCERQLLGVSETYRIEFERDTAGLEPGAEPALHRLVEVLADCPELKIAIVGYTDGQEDERDKRSLRLARAEAVRDSLTNRGIDKRRLLVISGTVDKEVAGGFPRRSKRRVEFVVDPGD